MNPTGLEAHLWKAVYRALRVTPKKRTVAQAELIQMGPYRAIMSLRGGKREWIDRIHATLFPPPPKRWWRTGLVKLRTRRQELAWARRLKKCWSVAATEGC
jgi:hypothetical protein